jgi:protein TonB
MVSAVRLEPPPVLAQTPPPLVVAPPMPVVAPASAGAYVPPAPARVAARTRGSVAESARRRGAHFQVGHGTKVLAGVGAVVVLLVLGTPAVQRWQGQRDEVPPMGVDAGLPEVVDAVPIEALEVQVAPAPTVAPPASPVAPKPAPSPTSKMAGAKAAKKAKPVEVAKVVEPVAEPAPVVMQARAVSVPTALPPPVATPDESTAPFTGQAFEVTQVDVRPQVTSQIAADVPAHLSQRRFQDVVVLRVRVSAAGKPADVRVLRKSNLDAALDGAAVAAVKQWRFQPAKKRGEAVNCWMNIGVPFHGVTEGTR